MAKVLFISNTARNLYNFRLELIEKLLTYNDVYVLIPDSKDKKILEDMGCNCITVKINRRGKSIFADIILFFNYLRIINRVNPDIVLSYTIKPNIYGAIACRIAKVPIIPSITGLGVVNGELFLLDKLTTFLYRLAFKKADCVFFQNVENLKCFKEKHILKGRYKLVPGSGVNLKSFKDTKYPPETEKINFLMVSRIMKSKGIDELIESSKYIKEKYSNVEFNIVGLCEENYEEKLRKLTKEGVLNYHGFKADVKPFIEKAHAVLLPSYHEGMSNSLLEAAAMSRPVLASNVAGCMETFDEGISGFGFKVKSVDDLNAKLIKFIELPYKEKLAMGLAGRSKMEREFDRNLVVSAYVREIDSILS